MQKPLIIFGTGSLARLAYYYIAHEMELNVSAFVVDKFHKTTETCQGLPVLDWDALLDLYSPSQTAMYIAVGYKSMKQRESVFERAIEREYQLINIISRAAFIAKSVSIGTNNFIMPGVVIEPGVSIGYNNVVWSNATICHNSKVGNHNFLASNVTVGGEVTMGDRNFLGFSSVVLQQRHLGNDVLIGAQSLLLSDAESLTHYQGTPAKKLKTIDRALGICVN
jgi:sugar O-acyltransferase (sialic acid O-acetyltransferase NeuD family)